VLAGGRQRVLLMARVMEDDRRGEDVTRVVVTARVECC
jgi:hypothetical protein